MQNEDEIVFCEEDFKMTNFWVKEITDAIHFFRWLNNLFNLRNHLKEIGEPDNYSDNLFHGVMNLTLPEVDLDKYNTQSSIPLYVRYQINEFINNLGEKQQEDAQNRAASLSSHYDEEDESKEDEHEEVKEDDEPDELIDDTAISGISFKSFEI